MSQNSDKSFPDLSLSQETFNHLLGAVGMENHDGNILTSCYSFDYGDEGLEDNGIGIVPSTDQEPGSSTSLSIRRAILTPSDNVQLPGWCDSQQGGLGVAAGSSSESPFLSPCPRASLTPPCQPSSSGIGLDIISPEAAMTPMTPITPALSESDVVSSVMEGVADTSPAPPLLSTRSSIPVNTPFPGEYGFRLLDHELVEPQYKNSNFIYSSLKQRAYIKQDMTIPFHFTLTGSPPPGSVIRALCIHSAPENMADNLICCPKHVAFNQKKGLLFPHYFIRPAENTSGSSFWRDESSSRLSIITPFSSLQKSVIQGRYVALYMFPCHTSDFSKSGQFVQVIFTLECNSEVLGRATMDIRVCASPGRDRDVDHGKKKGKKANAVVPKKVDKKEKDPSPSPPPTVSEELAQQNGSRKRAISAQQVEITKCVAPPKRMCQVSKRKVIHQIETFPEVIPYIDVCVKMMEQVCGVPVSVDPPVASLQKQLSNTTNEPSPQFNTLESWLEHLGLMRYLKVLNKNGISDTAQVLTLTDEELKSWGLRTQAHRKTFLEGKRFILASTTTVEEEENSPVLFSQTQSSQKTNHTQSFEVVEITMTKSLSSSSSH